MALYEFEAIENYEGSRVIDRYRLEAPTFAEACFDAQINELDNAHENDREPSMYDEFKLVR